MFTSQHDVPEVLKRRIYEVVAAIPAGQVSTYGDIAAIIGGGIDARTVGYALNAIPKDASATVPWQRVINAQGGVSTRGLAQRHLLESEGVVFGPDQRVDLRAVRWAGPSAAWAAEHGCHPLPPPVVTPEQLSLL